MSRRSSGVSPTSGTPLKIEFLIGKHRCVSWRTLLSSRSQFGWLGNCLKEFAIPAAERDGVSSASVAAFFRSGYLACFRSGMVRQLIFGVTPAGIAAGGHDAGTDSRLV